MRRARQGGLRGAVRPHRPHHGWRHSLEPGAAFRTVPAASSFSADGGPDAAFAGLTRYRRAQRRPLADHHRLAVIFSDYMNCLMGDPTTEKLLPQTGPSGLLPVVSDRHQLPLPFFSMSSLYQSRSLSPPEDFQLAMKAWTSDIFLLPRT